MEFVKLLKLLLAFGVPFQYLFIQQMCFKLYTHRHQQLKEQVDKYKIYEEYMMKILDLLPEGKKLHRLKYITCLSELFPNLTYIEH